MKNEMLTTKLSLTTLSNVGYGYTLLDCTSARESINYYTAFMLVK